MLNNHKNLSASELPDLRTGFLFSGIKSEVTWRSDISAALIEGDNPEPALLGKECRSEHIRDQFPLFSPVSLEVSVITTPFGDYILRSGSASCAGGKCPKAYQEYFGGVKAVLGIQAVRYMAFDEVIQGLKSEQAVANLFMRTDYYFQEVKYTILSKVSYMNFPTVGAGFLQPIVGPVLFKKGKKYFKAYLVVHIKSDGSQKTEVVMRKKTSILNSRKGLYGKKRRFLLGLILFPFRSLLNFSEFSEAVRLDATTHFFEYV